MGSYEPRHKGGTQVSRDTEKAYVGICEHGKVRAIWIDTPDCRKEIARDIADWVLNGLTVQHIDGKEAREKIGFRCEGCDAKRQTTDDAQLPLLAAGRRG